MTSVSEFVNRIKEINQVQSLPQNIQAINNKYEKSYEIVKQYLSKILLSIESTLFTLLKSNNTEINLQYNHANTYINSLLSNFFNLTYHMLHMDKYKCPYYDSLIYLLGETKMHVLHRIIYITTDFYALLNRSNLRVDNFDNYLLDFGKEFDEVFDSMKYNIYASLAQRIEMEVPEYVKDYNPFHIRLDTTVEDSE